MKKVLTMTTCILAVTLLSGPAAALLTVDGSISDWSPGSIRTDAVGDGPGEAEVLRWGVQVQGKYMYTFMEMDKDIATYDVGTNDAWLGLWVDVDNYSGPVAYAWGMWRRDPINNDPEYTYVYMGPSLANILPYWVVPEWAGGVHQGIDIEPEWQINEDHWPAWGGYNWWGAEDCMGVIDEPIQKSQVAYQGQIIETRFKMTELLARVKTYTDCLNGTCVPGTTWKVAARGEACINEEGWGCDGVAPETVNVPSLMADSCDYYEVTPSNPSTVLDGSWSHSFGSGITLWKWYVEGQYVGSGETLALTYATMDSLGMGSEGDYELMLQVYDGQWDTDYGTVHVPEPTTLALLAVGAIGMLVRRRGVRR